MPHTAGLDVALAIAMGVGLAAAVGFRVFLPMLVLSIAAYIGHLSLSSGLAWSGTLPALVMLSVAAVVESYGACSARNAPPRPLQVQAHLPERYG